MYTPWLNKFLACKMPQVQSFRSEECTGNESLSSYISGHRWRDAVSRSETRVYKRNVTGVD